MMASNAINEWQSQGYTVYPLSDFIPWTNFSPNIPNNLLPPDEIVYWQSEVSGRQVIEDSYVIYKCTGYSKKIQLLSTKWGQEYPYNMYIPAHPQNPNKRVGCTAVALGQILAYKKAHEGYEFDNMFDPYASNNGEISRLLYNIGTAIGIKYANAIREQRIPKLLMLSQSMG